MLLKQKILPLIAGAMMASVGLAQAPADAPAGSTGLCRDGSYWSGATKKGACHGHKGVQDWYAAAGSPAAAAPAPAAVAPTPAVAPAAPVAAPAASPAAPAPSPAASKASNAPSATAAPGGGPGLVWVNTSSSVYHCSADRWYGKTKHGMYMSESDAVAKGDRPDHGKACK